MRSDMRKSECIRKYQLSQMDPRDALLYVHRAADRGGRSV